MVFPHLIVWRVAIFHRPLLVCHRTHEALHSLPVHHHTLDALSIRLLLIQRYHSCFFLAVAIIYSSNSLSAFLICPITFCISGLSLLFSIIPLRYIFACNILIVYFSFYPLPVAKERVVSYLFGMQRFSNFL